TWPALPTEPVAAAALIPLGVPSAAAPDRPTSPATVTPTSPPLPNPPAMLAICAPFCTVRLPACTVTAPPFPDCAPVAQAAIWVPEPLIPSSTSAPGAVPSTEPPPPLPAVVLAIAAPLVTEI